MDFIKKWFKESGPLSSKRIHRELNGHSVHGRHIITGADKSNFGDMIVYYINRNKYNNIPIIYLHGGAYLHGLNPLHFKFCHSLSNIVKSPVTLLDYPLLPDENHKAAYDKVLRYLEQFENYILIGDSAGGGLALGCILHQSFHNKPLPKKTILMSPWVDVTMSTPEISHLESLDFVLNRETLIEIGLRWAGDKDPKDYMISPAYGPCETLDNIMLISGDEELFTPDLRKLSKRLNKETCHYIEGKHMFHDYILFTSMGLREADDTFTEIIKFLKDIPNS